MNESTTGARRRPAWRAEALLALGAALLALVLLAIGFNAAWPLTLPFGERDARFIAGFHAVERFGALPARWSGPVAMIALPQLPGNTSGILELRLLNSRPPDQPNPHVALAASGRALGEFDVPRTPGGTRRFYVLVPPHQQFDWATRFTLTSSTFSPPSDSRALGTVVAQAALRPSGAAWLLPSLWLLCWSAVLGLVTYTLPRSAGLGKGLALALAATLGALVAWGVAARPLEVLPFVQRIAALLGMACLGIWAARLLALPHRTAQGRLALRGADLPIYLGVAAWLGPLFEMIMTADGAVNVQAPLATRLLGGAALVLLSLGGAYLALSRTWRQARSSGAIATGALAILALAALAHLGYMVWFAFQRAGPDFWILFKGARDWARGGSLYDITAVVTNHFGHVFKVPPFYGMLFVPFVFQDGERILFFHRLLNVAMLGATVLVWFRMWGLRLVSAAGAGVLILLNFRAFADTIAFGQIDVALLLTLVLALWALRARRDGLAGGLVALGVLFKIYPVLLLAFFVVKRRWHALLGFALGMALLNGVAVAVMGWEMHHVYLSQVLPRIGGTTSWVENQTISGFLARLAAPPTASEIYQDRAITLLGLALSGLAGLLGCILALGHARAAGTHFALQYSIFPLLMVLVVPAAWMHYETLLFIPFAALLLHARERELPLGRAVALAGAFALIGYGNQWSFYDGTVMGILTVAGVSYKFYGMLLLCGVLGLTLAEELALARRFPRLVRRHAAPADIVILYDFVNKKRGSGGAAPMKKFSHFANPVGLLLEDLISSELYTRHRL